jgi:SAM-dependent methyltransferase
MATTSAVPGTLETHASGDGAHASYDQGGLQETRRLRSLEAEFDPGTCRLLEAIGVGEGWNSLEVGAGAGSIARWLARRSAPSGHVVAIDLDLRHMDCDGLPNLEMRRQDIVSDDVGEGVFDLVHARAVLEHVPDRQEALRRMVAAVKPGGWLLIEDTDFRASMMSLMSRYMSVDSEVTERVMGAFEPLYHSAGADPWYGVGLTHALRDCALEDVQGEVRARILPGGVDDLRHLTLKIVKPTMLAQGLVSEPDIDRVIDLAADPGSLMPSVVLVAGWGRRPRDRRTNR